METIGDIVQRLELAQFVVVLRDVMVILSTAALVAMSLFGALVIWELYKLGRDVYTELMPILESVQGTSATIQTTAEFLGRRFMNPATGTISFGYGAYQLFLQIRQFYRDLNRRDTAL